VAVVESAEEGDDSLNRRAVEHSERVVFAPFLAILLKKMLNLRADAVMSEEAVRTCVTEAE
jgi:hypothetical protein